MADEKDDAKNSSGSGGKDTKPLRLLSKIDGISTHFGEMVTGEELTTFDGEPLTDKQRRDFAKESEFLELDGG